MIKYFKYINIILLILAFLSCKSIVGVKDINYISLDNQINMFATKYLDSNILSGKIKDDFKSTINESDLSVQAKKNLLQPLQVFYFNKDSLISYHVNCNAGGFPNLKWNRNRNFDVFPPKNQRDTLYFGKQEMEIILMSNIMFYPPVNIDCIDKSEFTIIVFYSLMLEKQSERLFEYVIENLKLTNKTYRLLLVNVDNNFKQ